MTVTLLSCVRDGLAAQVPAGVAPDASGRLTLGAAATVAGAEGREISVTLLGPGDVTGLDARQIIRMDPPAGAQGSEPNLFAQVELDRPDLPWLFSPGAPDAQGRLQPWIALVVVEMREGVTLRQLAGQQLPVLQVDAVEELPDPADAWAWAHAQIAGQAQTAEQVTAAVRGAPGLTLSRLLCPRLLKPNARYHACIVPTFEAGRLAGLGQEPSGGTAPAWAAGAPAPPLPVYHHWEFVTGDPGDFETLARRVEGIDPPDGIGVRALDVSDPAGPSLARPRASLAFNGPLRTTAQTTRPWGDASAEQTLADLVDGATGPVVGPPLYGGKAVAVGAVPVGARPRPLWLRELNLDPRHRGTAALGARIVREHQEELMAAAWQQAGAIEEANRRLRAARMARRTGRAIVEGRLARLAPSKLLAIGAPSLDRLPPHADGTLASARLRDDTRLPPGVVQPAFRRLTRPGGRLGRMMGGPLKAGGVTDALDAGRARPDRSLDADPGTLVTIGGLLDAARGGRRGLPRGPLPGGGRGLPGRGQSLPSARSLQQLGRAVAEPELLDGFAGSVELTIGGRPVELTDEVRVGLGGVLREPAATPPAPQPVAALNALRGELLTGLDPRVTLPAALAVELTLDPALQGDDPLDEVLAAPSFPAPLAPELAELSGDLLLPGADRAPDDSAFALVTNAAYVQALLVGANHEMARELRWRGFPTDERGTCFHHFWDARGTTDDPAGPPPEIRAIDGFAPAGRLGDEVGGGRRQVVLVLRAELFRRYPGTQVLAVPGAVAVGGTRRPRYDAPELPRFRGRIGTDILYFGFAFDELQARGDARDPGYFAVFQQAPGAPRFGLDEADPANELTRRPAWPASLSDLTWAHVLRPLDPARAAEGAALEGWVDLDGPAVPFGAEPSVRWGESASGQARVTWQQPVRIAIHFSDLLGSGA
ncbi:MAG TPA: hypothetical protein VK506_10500 [Conexibacter sp.]|nr:hypothetical protein [Conexibacter sp.]